ncbi:MAG: ABC transporter permease [Clostridia bacterium]|nr:ABC transporter permease [Clostridia bacterium]
MLKSVRSTIIMIHECISMSISNIWGNKVRSFLTVLGILIGVTAVIALITTVSGVSSSIASSFTSLGAGTISVSVAGSDLKEGLIKEDLATLTALAEVDGITPTVSLRAQITHAGKTSSNIHVSGKSSYYFHLNEDIVTHGRELNFIDEDNISFVCLVSDEIVDTFFFAVNPIGETIYINGTPFTIVGRFKEDSSSGIAAIFSGKSNIFIPYTTALKMNNSSTITNFTVYMAEGVTSDKASSALETAMDPMFSYEEDTYTITTMDSIEDTMETMTGMMSTLLGGIASIALVVGGIGIMNMMLTTVTERTMEIGLKKALGARSWQIQIQFLIESFMLSLIGGIAGVLLGLLLSLILSEVIGSTFVVSGKAIALGVGFSAAVGILFGWAPARKASRLNPIDALRSM